tara:strand:- start:82 stop:360 length:279 start_codon:yes stop_codon:yes gene_type:complete
MYQAVLNTKAITIQKKFREYHARKNDSKSINRDSKTTTSVTYAISTVPSLTNATPKTTTNLPVQTRNILESLQNDTDDYVRKAVANLKLAET